MKYGFLGTGNMSGAIIRGLAKTGSAKIYGYDPSEDALTRLAADCGMIPCKSAEELIAMADVLVLGVKPNVLPAVLAAQSRNILERAPLVVSIAAGKTVAFIEGCLPGLPVIRVMPNINAKVLSATSAYCTNGLCGEKEERIAEDMLSAVGSIRKLGEPELDIFSALASASIAYTYLYIDALAEAALKAGMPKKKALEIAADSVLGSARMVLAGGEHPRQLIDQVCSPAGTTIEGLLALQERGFETAVTKAIEAVLEKNKKIGEDGK